MAKPEEIVSNAIASTSLWSSKNAKAVVLVVLLLTGIMGYGITLITTNVDVADVLPRGNPNTEAAHNLTAHFKSTFTQQVTFQLHIDEDGKYWDRDDQALAFRSTQKDVGNITDEVYIRAMQELADFIESRTDFDRQVSINNIYALINWTLAGGDGYNGQGTASEEDFKLPGSNSQQESLQYLAVEQAVQVAVLDTVDALSAPKWDHGALLFMPAADSPTDMRTLGDQIIAARDAYVAAVDAGDTEFTVWGSHNPPLLTVDLPVANSHSSNLVEEDMVKLMPIIALLIIVFLFIAFRNIRSIIISFTALGVGVTWTYGTMGYMGIALNTLNMTIVPLIMGVGIDYAIHMINEFLEHKSHGSTDAEAFQEAGSRAGLAMFIATLTTVLGLVVMMISPSLLMAQLGFLSAIAIAAIFVLTITFIPAALALLGGTEKMGASFTPSSFMPNLGRAVSRGRFAVIGIVGLLSVGAYASSLNLEEEAFGDPGKNFPADDPVRQEHEQGLKWFYDMEEPDVKANILTFEGPGILSPDAIAYYRTIEANLKQQDLVIADTLRTIPFFLETWLTIKGGGPCAVAALGAESAPDTLDTILGPLGAGGAPCADQTVFPTTEEEIRAETNAMYASPMRELASIILNHPTMTMGAMTFSVQAATYDEAEMVWHEVWSAVAAANQTFGGEAPKGVHVAFVGNTATNYLFVAEELPWLTYMSVAATIILFLLVLIFTRDLKATIVATALAGITSIWWLGILPFLNIGLAITLMLPLVFIFNIGTDYAVHIIWNLKKVGDAREVLETTGKAILFSAITTAGAFAIFTFIRNVAVSRTMIATTLAIFVIFAATMLVIPAFYRVYPKGERDPRAKTIEAEAAAPVAEAAPADQSDAPKKVKAVRRPKASSAEES